MRHGPTRSMIARKTGSDFLRWLTAFRMTSTFTTKRSKGEQKPNHGEECRLLRLLDGDSQYFISPAAQQFVHSNERPCRIVPAEIGLIYGVEGVVVLEVGTEDLQRDHIVHGQAGSLDGLLDSIHHEPHLVFGAGGWHAGL